MKSETERAQESESEIKIMKCKSFCSYFFFFFISAEAAKKLCHESRVHTQTHTPNTYICIVKSLLKRSILNYNLSNYFVITVWHRQQQHKGSLMPRKRHRKKQTKERTGSHRAAESERQFISTKDRRGTKTKLQRVGFSAKS